MALLAIVDSGESLLGDQLSAEMLAAIWGEVALLHEAGIAHGNLTLESFGIIDGVPIMGDLASASLSCDRRTAEP